MKVSRKQVQNSVKSLEGVRSLIAARADETDFVEFKREVELRDPRQLEELRADCASLATAGVGYLLIGIEESRDGRNEAAGVHGVENAVDLKRAIEDRLGNDFSPPLDTRHVSLIRVDERMDVVCVRLEGRPRYPIELLGSAPARAYIVREAGKKKWLTPNEALARRQRIDFLRGARRAGVVPALLVLALIAGGFWLQVARKTPRDISEAQIAILRARLSKTPGREIYVHYPTGDAEAQIYAETFHSVLRRAGWRPWMKPWPDGPQFVGLSIWVPGSTDKHCADFPDSSGYRFAYALKEAGFEAEMDCTPGGLSNLFVGHHPRSENGEAVRRLVPIEERNDLARLPPPPDPTTEQQQWLAAGPHFLLDQKTAEAVVLLMKKPEHLGTLSVDAEKSDGSHVALTIERDYLDGFTIQGFGRFTLVWIDDPPALRPIF